MAMTVPQLLGLAVEHHQAGRLAEAERLYREVLEREPGNADALHLLGVAAHQAGNNETALGLIRQAVAANPSAGDFRSNLALVLRALNRAAEAVQEAHKGVELNSASAMGQFIFGQALGSVGRMEEGVICFRRAVDLKPDFFDAMEMLAGALRALGRTDEAVGWYRRCVTLNPNAARTFKDLAATLRETGRSKESLAAYRRAVELGPEDVEALDSLGIALAHNGELDEAMATFRRALQLMPGRAEMHNNLANVLKDQGKLDEAIAAYGQAARLRPEVPLAHYNLGTALNERGKLDEAIAAFGEALRLKPDYANAWNNLGIALMSRRRLEEAVTAFTNAVRIEPEFDDAQWNLGWVLLLAGDFEKGWPQYEMRWRSSNFRGAWRDFVQPQWDGGDLHGRRILLHAEGGIGDTVQFIRYAPLVAGRGGRVIVSCQPEMVELLRGCAGVEELLATGQPLPPFDVHCPLMSLPLAFKTDLQSIPSTTPYLKADADRIAAWSRRLPPDPHHPRIGLAWAGRPQNRNDRNRSIRLDQLAPLSAMKQARFFSLQKGPAAGQARRPPAAMELIDYTDELHDLADTAAMLAHLDLIVTVDTAVAHLAGALARPVWVMLPYVPDWRWMLDRDDSPWYPTMRLFRQTRMGDWSGPIQEISRLMPSAVAR
ncbi:MAG: tetratricopeptide repeat protein [Tepidisphaeraceae bacterium]